MEEEKLEILGLNYKETEEFIVYWLPKLEQNEYWSTRTKIRDTNKRSICGSRVGRNRNKQRYSEIE